MKHRTILHIDFDSFFASVEQQYHPQFRNKPLGVTATNGRTCIIASSREAKALGIKTGCRTFDAMRIYPRINLIGADFVKYWEISKKFIGICKDYSPLVEVFSLDELFMDVTDTVDLFGGINGLIWRLKHRIRQEIGEHITVSIGVSHNKLLAKLASDMRKPNGVFFIREQDVEEVYRKAKLDDICGIGPRIKLRLNMMGIYTLLQLRKTPLRYLVAEFGNIEGHFLRDVGQGVDVRMVMPFTQVPEVKSIGRNYCLPENMYDKRRVLQNFYELCEEIGIKLRKLSKKARTVGYYFSGTHLYTGRKTYTDYLSNGADIYRACRLLMPATFMKSGYTRSLHVWVSNLADDAVVPLSLFEISRVKHSSSLTRVIDSINSKFGNHTIRNGFVLNAPKLTTVPNGYGSDRYERMKLAKMNFDVL
jgi:DNA polymerase IV